eukprot:GHVH01014636.1.p1 GENE.GHVH01014636.1~~GHVH01014636.1.p1  ORF type:complete len:401 (-),score=68.20 GHVH01014636.1:3403-4605(-)
MRHKKSWLESEESEYEEESPNEIDVDEPVAAGGAASLDIWGALNIDSPTNDTGKGGKAEVGAPRYIGSDGAEQTTKDEPGGMTKKQAVQGFARQARAMTKCGFCAESKNFQIHRSHEIFSMNDSIDGCYLSVMGWQHAIHPLHLRIVPLSHRPSTVSLDEDTSEYLRTYQKLLVRFFDARSMVPLFLETASSAPTQEALMLGGGHHVSVEVIPIPFDRLEEARMSFRESFLSAGEEWSENPKMLITSKEKYPLVRHPPKGIIPPGIPYVHVDFGLSGGYAHVIEKKEDGDIDNVDVSAKFLREIAMGVLNQNIFDRAFRTELSWRQNLTKFWADWRQNSNDPYVLSSGMKEPVEMKNEVQPARQRDNKIEVTRDRDDRTDSKNREARGSEEDIDLDFSDD